MRLSNVRKDMEEGGTWKGNMGEGEQEEEKWENCQPTCMTYERDCMVAYECNI